MKKRLLAALLCGAMTLGLAACGGGTDGSAANNDDGASGPAKNDFTVGICQLTQHTALDAATKGFREKLTALMEADGKTVSFDEQNAAGDPANCGTIVTSLVSKNVDLILANATPSLQAAAAGTDSIPVLGTAVSEYGIALDLTDFTGKTGRNISGTSDLAPLDKQAEMLKQWFPDAKNVGLLYSSGEPNSKYQVDTIKGHLEAMGYTCTDYSFSDSNDLASVATVAADNSDVIYVPTDNSVADNAEIVNNICMPKKVPVIAGEEGIASGCGVATLSISYYELGEITGQMAYDILVGGKDIADMEIQHVPSLTQKYNAAICEQLGLTPPAGYEAIAA